MELVTGPADLLNRLAATVAEIESEAREFLARNYSIQDPVHAGDIAATLLARDLSIINTDPADRRRTIALALSRLRGDDPDLFAPDLGVRWTAAVTKAATRQTDHVSLLAQARYSSGDQRRRQVYAAVKRLKKEGRPVPRAPAEFESDAGLPLA